MKPEKAIEILTQAEKEPDILYSDDFVAALKLGIEALKFRLRWEQQEGEVDFSLLPGETKD